MSIKGLSPLAHLYNQRSKDVADRTAPIYGIVVHQTGSQIVEEAVKVKASPIEYAAEFYLNPENYFAHYVVGFNGEIIQIANEQERAQHVGITEADRQSYLNGTWEKKLPTVFVNHWKVQWPTYKSPAHLYPGKSVNNVTVGIEMLPVTTSVDEFPWFSTAKYTQHQHLAVIELCFDIATRNNFPLGWYKTGRLVGHEDVSPLTRTTKNPPAGWDPGWLRDKPWFEFDFVRNSLHTRSVSV